MVPLMVAEPLLKSWRRLSWALSLASINIELCL